MLQLFNNPNGRGGNEVMLSFAKLYQIIRDRLEYMGPNPDFDAVCQRVCVEIEKAMGTYPNIPTLVEGPTETPEVISAANAGTLYPPSHEPDNTEPAIPPGKAEQS